MPSLRSDSEGFDTKYRVIQSIGLPAGASPRPTVKLLGFDSGYCVLFSFATAGTSSGSPCCFATRMLATFPVVGKLIAMRSIADGLRGLRLRKNFRHDM